MKECCPKNTSLSVDSSWFIVRLWNRALVSFGLRKPSSVPRQTAKRPQYQRLTAVPVSVFEICMTEINQTGQVTFFLFVCYHINYLLLLLLWLDLIKATSDRFYRHIEICNDRNDSYLIISHVGQDNLDVRCNILLQLQLRLLPCFRIVLCFYAFH